MKNQQDEQHVDTHDIASMETVAISPLRQNRRVAARSAPRPPVPAWPGKWCLLLLVAAALVLGVPVPATGQAVPSVEDGAENQISREDAPRVYLDCRRCDDNHIRREITFVNHVRDPNLAQVHVLVTTQSTGSGGRLHTLAFLGRREFAGVDNTLTYLSPPLNAAAQERDGLTKILALGLVPYTARTPLADQLQLTYREAAVASVTPANDPWRHWTFEAYVGGNLSTESTQYAWNARYGFYANRVTEQWKIQLRPYFNNNARLIRQEGEADVRSSHRRHGFDSFVIRSLGAHWGSGLFADYITTTVDNLRHRVRSTVGVEYSLYPYDEASRREITFRYRGGFELADYFEESIYEKVEETLYTHSLEASVQFRQPWGSVSSSLTGSQYLHDASLYRVILDGRVSLRVVRGISLNFGGSYQRINDQLSLPREDASLEDILLERRRLATAYRGSANLGISYTFGSLFTNVVNPRF